MQYLKTHLKNCFLCCFVLNSFVLLFFFFCWNNWVSHNGTFANADRHLLSSVFYRELCVVIVYNWSLNYTFICWTIYYVLDNILSYVILIINQISLYQSHQSLIRELISHTLTHTLTHTHYQYSQVGIGRISYIEIYQIYIPTD